VASECLSRLAQDRLEARALFPYDRRRSSRGCARTSTDAPKVLVSPRNAEVAAGLAQRFATVDDAPDNQTVVDDTRVVIVCVRPAVAQTVLAELRFPADRVVISAMACVPVKALQRLVASVTDKLLRVRARGAIVGRVGFDARGDTTSSAVTMYRIEDGRKQVHPVITLSRRFALAAVARPELYGAVAASRLPGFTGRHPALLPARRKLLRELAARCGRHTRRRHAST
jgi:NADP oxidoreductase coenzyme F420-dependent